MRISHHCPRHVLLLLVGICICSITWGKLTKKGDEPNIVPVFTLRNRLTSRGKNYNFFLLNGFPDLSKVEVLYYMRGLYRVGYKRVRNQNPLWLCVVAVQGERGSPDPHCEPDGSAEQQH